MRNLFSLINCAAYLANHQATTSRAFKLRKKNWRTTELCLCVCATWNRNQCNRSRSSALNVWIFGPLGLIYTVRNEGERTYCRHERTTSTTVSIKANYELVTRENVQRVKGESRIKSIPGLLLLWLSFFRLWMIIPGCLSAEYALPGRG